MNARETLSGEASSNAGETLLYRARLQSLAEVLDPARRGSAAMIARRSSTSLGSPRASRSRP
jgi:hypothetical protein